MEANISRYIDIAVPIRGRCPATSIVAGAATFGVEYFRNATSTKGNGCYVDFARMNSLATNACSGRKVRIAGTTPRGDVCDTREASSSFRLGSGLIDQSQKMSAAAMQIAEK